MAANTSLNTSSLSGLSAAQQDRRSDMLVIVLCLAALVAGWFVKTAFQFRTETFSIPVDTADKSLGAVNLSLPSTWVWAHENTTDTLTLPAVFDDPQAASAYKSTLQADVRILEDPNPDVQLTLNTYVDRAVEAHTKDLVGYQLLSNATDTKVTDADARVIEYAYVARRIDVQVRNALPVVVRALDYIVVKGNRVYLFTTSVDARAYDAEAEHLRAIINSIQLP